MHNDFTLEKHDMMIGESPFPFAFMLENGYNQQGGF